ncbi:ureidoglycolate lyase [Afifella sp. IM 167]|uniref:ureidoglycolate lyase n=1 Tax=Afifella sp. IM 167 TaxID=2033586 RepID=UPI001CCB7442|nr:ureidoglycolate lyase [Afifella sp. IM 167]MBZ8135107.1 ureidoglycolate lyase [Afifella sp. IM 167]
MNEGIAVLPLTRDAFRPFGEVIAAKGVDPVFINRGKAKRFHALATADTGEAGGRAIISLFSGDPYELPIPISMMERHPLASQAFMPLSGRPWLVVVAPDERGQPGRPVAFLAEGEEGVQFARGVWHHPLIALGGRADFLVVDRAGPEGEAAEVNLEEFFYPAPFLVHAVG